MTNKFILFFFLLSTFICQVAIGANKGISVVHSSKKYALLISVSDYKDHSIPDLKYTVNDQLLLGETLIKTLDFDPHNIVSLIDESATKENIENEINRISEYAGIDDVVMIYFSGHGSYGEDLDNDESDGTDEYLIPWDATYGKLYTAISDDIFGYWLTRIRSKRVLVILDSCNSGGAAKGTRGVQMSQTRVRATSKDNIVSDVSRKDIVILTASTAEQLSQESRLLGRGHGVFTYFLCESIVDGCKTNDLVDIDKLYARIVTKVNDFTFQNNLLKQTPLMLNRIRMPLHYLFKDVTVVYEKPTNGKILVENARTEKVKIKDGYYKTVKKPGYFKSDLGGLAQTYVPGHSEKIWIEPEYKYVNTPAKYQEVHGGRGKFNIIK